MHPDDPESYVSSSLFFVFFGFCVIHSNLRKILEKEIGVTHHIPKMMYYVKQMHPDDPESYPSGSLFFWALR
jgi:hypothetical protein